MTRKHYILIADAIKENILYKPNDKEYKPIDVDLKGLINSLSYVFKCDNNNFDGQRFKDYVSDNNV
jgi:hypothetical protein|tara:strand:+ start:55 stop:252 length:198 start_codon:yes stop_codon:yes gene_type:complete